MATTPSIKKITLIGAGNVATQLGTALHKAGYAIQQVYSPSAKSASILAKRINAQAITDLKNLDTTAAIYIIAIKDDAIATLAKQLSFNEQVVVHTSGSVEMSVLKNTSKNYGVFYPLQTFSKTKAVDFKTVPICIEASNKSTTALLKRFAKTISNDVQEIDSRQRKILHIGAVFACNFTNHLYAIADAFLGKHQLSFNLLKPLIAETADKIKQHDPASMQTGPAIRNDKKTMDVHIKLLAADKDLKTIYKLLSNHIRK
ncbi:MAG TPA: Rossmann-like and DUF2520 domain-containing protein [Bacteroidia bacterium]|jgi:predicted short-subunit dehydrogenase-like oxidoreductase (DUF2520 family)|nr:Rossmann-like and DUF2520 domain-containing protein [Bacteroidia bacterium]